MPHSAAAAGPRTDAIVNATLGLVSDCPFCALPPDRVVASTPLTWTIRDGYPASPGHTLLIPRRHVADWFETTVEEQAALLAAARDARASLQTEFRPDGYNLGVNAGHVAGQTVMHVHLHLIPRYVGDVSDPRGGIRHCIPHRGHYDPSRPPQ